MTSSLLYDWNSVPPLGRTVVQDETLRDGVQGTAWNDPTLDHKRHLIERMVDLGVESVNLGMPGAGARALADVRALAQLIVKEGWPIAATCAARATPRDIECIVDISQQSGLAIEIGTFIGASALRQSVEKWSLDAMRRSIALAVSLARGSGHEVMFVTEDTTRADPEALQLLYGEALQYGAQRLCACDTTGSATPAGVERLVRFIHDEIIVPMGEPIALDWHGHRDRGLGVANALAARQAGAQRIHATALGVGERSGNVEMELLLVNLNLAGDTHYHLRHLMPYSQAAAEAFGVSIPDHAPIVGANAFRTSAGVHASAIRKAFALGGESLAEQVYCGVPASLVGRTQEVAISAFSGVANVRWWLDRHGYDATDDHLVHYIIEAAKRQTHLLGDAALYALVAEALAANRLATPRPGMVRTLADENGHESSHNGTKSSRPRRLTDRGRDIVPESHGDIRSDVRV